jgi:hypothetical protein
MNALPRRLDLRVLRPLTAGVRAELRLGDTGKALAAARALVPGSFAKGSKRRPNLRLVHAVSCHDSVTVSNMTLDTVAELCYHGFVGSKQEARYDNEEMSPLREAGRSRGIASVWLADSLAPAEAEEPPAMGLGEDRKLQRQRDRAAIAQESCGSVNPSHAEDTAK